MEWFFKQKMELLWMILTNWENWGWKVLTQKAGGKELGEVQVITQQRRDCTGLYEDDGDSKQQQYNRDHPPVLLPFLGLIQD